MSEEPSADAELETKLEALGEAWGFLVVTHRPKYSDDFRWTIANHTDEGLGPGERRSVQGATLEEAVEAALRGDSEEIV
jgi:hypothetical protein